MKTIAIIPARGGSKRIPRKNIKEFFGQPIIKYSIDASLASGIFDEVMVSTDDNEIASIAMECGAAVPFLRSEKNSDDMSTTADVLEEVLLEYKKHGKEYEYAFCVYPTAPFVTAEKIKKAVELIKQSEADTVLPVTRFSYPIQRSLKIEDDGRLTMIWPENMNVRSQDLLPAYHDIGQYFCINVKKFLQHKKIFTENTVPILVPDSEVQDIDSEEDWKVAEIKYKLLNNALI